MPLTLDRLPELTSTYPLAQDQIDSFQRDGHVLLRGVCTSDEVAAYRQAITDYVERHRPPSVEMSQRSTYAKAFVQLGNLWQNDETGQIKPFVLSPRFAGIAAGLLGVDGVRLYHDQALYKEPGGGPTPWHQDQFYWPLATSKTVTMWMALVDVELEMGPVAFAPGTHTQGHLNPLGISDESEAYFTQYVKEQGITLSTQALKAGDATFHYGWTLHKAGGNFSDTMREAMTIIYFEDGALVSEIDSEARALDQAAFFPGLNPGDLAASPLNPRL